MIYAYGLRKAIQEVYDYGTPEATKHAKKMTPGQNVKEDDDVKAAMRKLFGKKALFKTA